MLLIGFFRHIEAIFLIFQFFDLWANSKILYIRRPISIDLNLELGYILNLRFLYHFKNNFCFSLSNCAALLPKNFNCLQDHYFIGDFDKNCVFLIYLV